MTENEKIELKFILKSLLISTPRAITVDELFSDYAKQEGHVFPFRKFGFSCFIDFLLSIPDTVNVSTLNVVKLLNISISLLTKFMHIE